MILAGGKAILLVSVLGVIFLAVGYAVLRMFAMWLDREISGLELLIWLFVYMASFAMAVTSWGSPMFGLVILLCLFLAVAYPVGIYLVEIHGRRQMRTMDIAAYSRAYEENPKNPYPLRRLGELFFASQDYELAIKYYEQYLEHVKDGQAARRIKRAREFLRQLPQETRVCPRCTGSNPKSVSHCIECGEALPGLGEFLEPFRAGRGMSVLLGIAAGAMALGLGIALLQILTERFAPLLAQIFVPFMLLVAITSFCAYLYVRMSR